jgi:LPXTG-motif cell wall-anchored protein
MTAALTLASPASAHHPTVSGKATCEDGGWIVTWTVRNSERDLTGEVRAVTLTPAGTTVDGIAVGDTLPMRGNGVLTGVQKVDAGATRASLEVTVKWIRNGKKIVQSDKGSVKLKGKCKPETPPTTPPATESPSPSPSAPAESPSAPASPTPPAPGGGGGGPELPVTGASLGTAAGVGAALLAIGTGLFFFFRRRRVRFTA